MNSYLQLILSLADRALELWNHERKTKYQKEVLKLKKMYAEENDKEKPDHSKLDYYERELFFLCDLVNTEIKTTGQASDRMLS